MSTLYRKYRPQRFAEVIGQDHVKITLQNEIARGEIGHAYLFCGPRGLGKTTLARLFAKAANCHNRLTGGNEPCNQCPSCLAIVNNNSVDIIEIDAASHTGVDNVRLSIIENSRFMPSSSRYKVFIIDEAHMLSTAAFNALLKTLEEPPAHVIFILCTTEIHKLPPTIISRCQRFDLKKVAAVVLKKRLAEIVKAEDKKIDDSVLDNVIIHSEGCVRDAESLLGKLLTLGDEITAEQAEIILPRSDFRQVYDFLRAVADYQPAAAIELVNVLVEGGVDLQVFADNLLEFLRQVMLVKVGGRLGEFGIELDESGQAAVAELAEKLDYDRLLATMELFLAKRREIKTSLIPQLPLELAVVQLTETTPTAEDSHDDDFTGPNGAAGDVDLSRPQRVKQKIKEGLSHLNPRKNRDSESPLENVYLAKNSAAEVKVDLTSNRDKLAPVAVIKLNRVKENWQTVVEKLLEKNYALSSLLRISEPLKCDGNILEIGVRSRFYHDQLTNHRNQIIVSKAISEVIQAEVKIRTVVRDKVEPIPMEIDGIGQAAAEAPVVESSKIDNPTYPADKPYLAADKPTYPVDKPYLAADKPADVAQDVMNMF